MRVSTSSLAVLAAAIGCHPPATSAIAVDPPFLYFGGVPSGGSAERTFTVSNLGGAVLTGAATAEAPFQVVGEASYSLMQGRSQTITVRYTPASVASDRGSVLCSGGGGVKVGLSTLPQALDRAYALRPLKGMRYKPSPRDYGATTIGIYYDSDFANDDFAQLWGPAGRDDLGKLAVAGVNFIMPYDWNPPPARHHRRFMEYCAQQKISLGVAFSVYFVNQVAAGNPMVPQWIHNMLVEVYPNRVRAPAVILWAVGNEYNNGIGTTALDIANSVKAIVAGEDAAGIPESERVAFTSPVAFIRGAGDTEGVEAVLGLRKAFQEVGISKVFDERFIAAVNSFNPGSDLAPWSARFAVETNGMPFFLAEVGREIGSGVATEEDQAGYYGSQLSTMIPLARKEGTFLGASVFSTVDEPYKHGGEATFGVYRNDLTIAPKVGTTVNGVGYPIDVLIEKPNFATMRDAFRQAQ